MWGKPGAILNSHSLLEQAHIGDLPEEEFLFPMSTLAYFQIVFAAITPILMLGSVLGRFNFKAWIPFVALWTLLVYTINAFLIWGGGFFAQQGAVDYSGGYVIHLAAGVSGFVAAAVIGPRLQRDREVDAPNNLAMVAVGAGLLWMGWNGFNGGDWYSAGEIASASVLNTNLCTAVAFLVWVALDYMTGRKPSLIGSVNGMIVGLVAITPGAGFVNGWGAIDHRRRRLDHRLLRAQLPEPRRDRSATSTTPSGWSTPTGSPESSAVSWSGSSPTTDGGERYSKGSISGGGLHLLGVQALTGALGDRVLGDRHVHPAQAGRPGRAAADERRGHGDRRHRRPRARGVPVRRAVARLPGWSARTRPHMLPGEAPRPPQQYDGQTDRYDGEPPPVVPRGRFFLPSPGGCRASSPAPG